MDETCSEEQLQESFSTSWLASARPMLLLTSDSSTLFSPSLVHRYFPSPPFHSITFPSTWPVLHIDKCPREQWSALDRHRGFRRVVAEFILLGMCDRAIISPSGFAAVATWRTAWKDGRRKAEDRYAAVQRFQQAEGEPKGRLSPFEHARGCGGRPKEKCRLYADAFRSSAPNRSIQFCMLAVAVTLIIACFAYRGNSRVRSSLHRIASCFCMRHKPQRKAEHGGDDHESEAMLPLES
jgi:hypothetical protein